LRRLYEQDRQRKPVPTAADRGTSDVGPAVTRASVLAEEGRQNQESRLL